MTKRITHTTFAAKFKNEPKVHHFTFEQWEPEPPVDVIGVDYEV